MWHNWNVSNGSVQETHKWRRLRANDEPPKLMFIQGFLQLAVGTKPSKLDQSKLEMKLWIQLESQNPNLQQYIISLHSPWSNSLDEITCITLNLHFIFLLVNLCHVLNYQIPLWKAAFRKLHVAIFPLNRRNFENPRMKFALDHMHILY